MAEAPVDSITFISLRDARALLAEAWQFAPHLAERDLREAWAGERIPTRVGRIRGRWQGDAPPPIVLLRQNAKTVRINWEHSSAFLLCNYGQVTFDLIELRREDVEKLLPAAWRERVATGVVVSAPPQSVAPTAPRNPMERPPPEANATIQLEWAYLELHTTNQLGGLKGKRLLDAACAEVGPKFGAGPSDRSSTFKIAKRRAKERLAKARST